MILYHCPDSHGWGQRIRALAIARKAQGDFVVSTTRPTEPLFTAEGVQHVYVQGDLHGIVKLNEPDLLVIDGQPPEVALWSEIKKLAPWALVRRVGSPRPAGVECFDVEEGDFAPVLIRDPAELPAIDRGGVMCSLNDSDAALLHAAWPEAVVVDHWPLMESMAGFKVVVGNVGRMATEAAGAGANFVGFARHDEEAERAQLLGIDLVDLADTAQLHAAIRRALDAPPPAPVVNKAGALASALQSLVSH